MSEMPVQSVQGFLRLGVTEDEAQRLLAYCRRERRYLIPSEASRILRKTLSKTITDEEQAQMTDVWLDFCRELDLDQQTSVCEVEVLEKWWPYVASHYVNPLPAPSAKAPWEVDI